MNPESRFLTLQEVADELGAPLGSVRHWTTAGADGVHILPSFRMGRHRKVAREDLEDFIAKLRGH